MLTEKQKALHKGRFSGSIMHEIIADGVPHDFSPDRDGIKGAYVMVNNGRRYNDEIYKTVAEYNAAATEEKKRLGKYYLSVGGKTCAKKKAMEIVADYPEINEYTSAYMELGDRNEARAMNDIAWQLGEHICHTGEEQETFLYGDDCCATPDGITESGVVIEVKCPAPHTFADYAMFIHNEDDVEKIVPKYYWQMQTEMLVTGCQIAYFCFYCPYIRNPDKQLFMIEVNRNEDAIERIKLKVKQAAEYRDRIVNLLS